MNRQQGEGIDRQTDRLFDITVLNLQCLKDLNRLCVFYLNLFSLVI